MSQPNQPPSGPNQPYGSGQQPQGQQTPPTQPQDPYRQQPAQQHQSYGSPYAGQQAQPQPQQPGQQPQPYGYGGYEPSAPQYAAQKKSGTLGAVALVLAVLATVGFIIFSVLSGQATVEIAQMSGGTIPEDATQVSQAAAEKATVAFGFMAAQAIPSLLGLAGLICGIVSAATRRGRALGVIAIVLSVIAPIIGFIVYATIVAPIAQT